MRRCGKTGPGGIAAVAGLVAALVAASAGAQETITLSLTLSEVLAGTSTPAAVQNGVIDPGEGLRVSLRFKMSPTIGATARWDTSGPGGLGIPGTVEGFSSSYFNLHGKGTGGEAGTWRPSRGPAGWISRIGDAVKEPGSLIMANGGQFMLPGVAPDRFDDIVFWSATWDPIWYDERPVEFRFLPYSQGVFLDVGIRDPEGRVLYVTDSWSPIPGAATLRYQIVPGPGSLAAAMGMLGLAGRRRRAPRCSGAGSSRSSLAQPGPG